MTAATPSVLPVDRYLRQLHSRFVGLREGAVADYIPPLAAADPEPFAISIATVDGQVYEVGDATTPFTIQSISKPFTYGLALEDRGLRHVLTRIGVEPSGDAFNEISLDAAGRPFNPMINAGAIMASSLIEGEDPMARLLERYGRWAGRPLTVDEAVYRAERDTGHRNRAIGHMLRAVGTLEGSPERALDVYFQQCSVEVTTGDLALMAATLAARGVNPVTGVRALPDEHIAQVLSLMTTCGMYDAAGEWLVDVGIPAKSGVGGGIIGVLPGQLGVAVFSPRLDPVGNSRRGVAVFRQLSADLRLHVLNPGRSNRSALHTVRTLAEAPSTRGRTPTERAALDEHGSSGVVARLEGDLLFAGAEAVSRSVLAVPRRWVVLDVSRTGAVDAAAARVLGALAREVARSGELVLAGPSDVTATAVGARAFPDVDAATEWCEQQVLARARVAPEPSRLDLADHPLTRAAAAAGVTDELTALLRPRTFARGDVVVHTGDDATEVFAVTDGEVEVSIAVADGGVRRLATMSAGMTFGESALTAGGRRTADVVARTDGACAVLRVADLAVASAELRAAVTGFLLAIAHRALDRSTREIAALAR